MLRLELLGFYQKLTDANERRLVTPEDCRIDEDFVDNTCRANRAPLQLVNLTGTAVIYRAEAQCLQTLSPMVVEHGRIVAHEGDNPDGRTEARSTVSNPPSTVMSK